MEAAVGVGEDGRRRRHPESTAGKLLEVVEGGVGDLSGGKEKEGGVGGLVGRSRACVYIQQETERLYVCVSLDWSDMSVYEKTRRVICVDCVLCIYVCV